MHCHVVEVASLQELTVAKRLEVRTFVPLYVREIRHARRITQRTYPLYSRYIFAWFDSREHREVLMTRGVRGVLHRAGSDLPAIVPERVIAGIRAVTGCADYTLGERLRVSGGRWDGLEGLFASKEEDRVMLLLSMLGRDIEIEVPRACVTRDLSVSETARY